MASETARRTTVRLRLRAPWTETDRFACYARLLEEAATTASTEAGYSPQWYEREGTAWVIRRTTIDCASAIDPLAEVEVVTWVADFRRVRSRRRYEVRLASGGEPVLRADTDWVYVERARGRPKRIPPAMMEAFVPGGAGAEPREALEIGPAPQAAFACDFVAAAEDVDALGHVNNTRSFAFLERGMAAASASAALGALPAGGAAARFRALRHDVEYLDEAYGGDPLRVRIWVVEKGAEQLETAAEIVRGTDDKRLTVARSRWARV
jgi:acyl-CoA thioester hydrolase